MTGAWVKSRKRSAANSPPQPRPTYFVDVSLGRKVAEHINRLGHSVIFQTDIFPGETKDEVWLRKVGEEGWVALTKDSNIRREPNVREAYLRAGARVFTLVGGSMDSSKMCAAFEAAFPGMERLLQRKQGPFIANVGKSGLTGTLYRW